MIILDLVLTIGVIAIVLKLREIGARRRLEREWAAAAAMAALKKRGHMPNCGARSGGWIAGPCTCGLSERIAAA